MVGVLYPIVGHNDVPCLKLITYEINKPIEIKSNFFTRSKTPLKINYRLARANKRPEFTTIQHQKICTH